MAGVWGRPKREEVPHAVVTSGEECTICYAAPQNVCFKPCNHGACHGCVGNLRRANIFKADAGVKCPYCRGYVESYQGVTEDSELSSDLTAANKAAEAAAATRHGPQMPSIQSVSAPQGVSNRATTERWHCSCGKMNTDFRERCSQCNKPNPIAPATKETEKKNIMKCSPDEILALALQKLHPSLDVAFQEAGMPVEPSSASSGNNLTVTGNEASLQVAIASKNGLDKLKRVVKSLTKNGHVHTLLFHWFGNYTLQDLVVASSKLRRSAEHMLLKPGQSEAQVAVLQDLIAGRNDLLGALVKEVSNDAVGAALHKQGTYALQKVLESPCRDSEFVQLGKSLMEQALELVGGEPGIYVMAKLVDQLVKAANNAEEDKEESAPAAQFLLDMVCNLYHSKQAKYTDSQRYEKLRYDMLIAAIDGALPMHNSAMLALMLARSAHEIQKKSPGRFLVKQLLKLQPRRSGSVQIMQNVVCHVGESFEQNLVELMLKSDDRPPHVVTVLMQELSANNENDWAEHLVGEMVEGAASFKHSQDAMHILKESLALSCFGEEFVREQLKALDSELSRSSKAGFDQAVWKERTKNLEAKEAVAAAESAAAAAVANGAADSGHDSDHESAKAGSSSSQDVPAASMPAASIPSMPAANMPAASMLSLQQQAAAQPPAAFGSVDFIPGLGPADFIDSAADAGESSQVSSQSSPNGGSSMKKASKTPPPGFAGTPSFSSSTADGAAGDAAGLVAPSPDRGRQASSSLQYNPLSGSPSHAPSQPRYTPSQSPERPSTSSDPLAFIIKQGQGYQHSSASAAPSVGSAGRTRPAYQPPSDSTLPQWMPPQQQAKGQKPGQSPQMSPKGQGSSQQAPQYAPRPYVPYNPHLTSDGSDSRAAKSGNAPSRSPGGPAMALNLGKLMLALLWVGLSLSAVQAQPSAQNINPNVSLTLNSTTLLYSGQTVTVSWSGVPNPTAADAVALVIPTSYAPDANLHNTVPLKYRWALQTNPNYLTTGSGSTTFRILNQRADPHFLFFSNITHSGNFSDVDVIARSPNITIVNYNEPTQGHLAYTGNQGEISVQWLTRDAGNPTVHYGTSSGSLTSTVTGNTTTYTRQDMCGAAANSYGWIDPGTMNNVILTNLTPSTTYYYTYGDPNFGNFSSQAHFLTPPAVGPNTSVYVLDTADMGHAEPDGSNEWEDDLNQRLYNAPGSIAEILSSITNQYNGNGLQQGAGLVITGMLEAELKNNPVLLWMNGDVNYARGFETQWDVGFDQYETISRQVPTMVAEGNHETDWPGRRPVGASDRFANTATDSGGECGIPFYKRYQMPSQYLKLWYSFDVGPIHNLVFSTELDYSRGSEQFNFILTDLMNVNRNVTPWVIVHGHRPAYATVVDTASVIQAQDQRNAFEDIFVETGVDMVLSGHVHNYQRTCEVFKNTCVPRAADGSSQAPVWIVNGNAGQWLSTAEPVIPPFFEAVAIEHGYLKYHVNQTTLFAEMVSAQTGNVFDSFTLTKPVGWKFNATAKAALVSGFIPTYQETLGQRYGYSGASAAATAILTVVYNNPQLFTGLANATLVQDINVLDTLANTLQILEPTFPLYLSPELQNSNLTSPAAKLYLNEFLVPQIPVLRAAVQNSEVGDLLLGTANDTNSLAKAFSYK
ncbi:hypothetical protein WJX82_003065 [Trebouxia sp. C0006]